MLFIAILSTLIVGIVVGIFIERNNSNRIENLLNQAKSDAQKISDTAQAVKNDIQKL